MPNRGRNPAGPNSPLKSIKEHSSIDSKMDGELDRETNDDGWGPGVILSTLGEQLTCVETVINSTHQPKEAKKQKESLRKTAERLMKEKGKNEGSSGNWGIIWQNKAMQAKEKEEEANSAAAGAGVMSGVRHRKEADKHAGRKAKFNHWVCLWETAKPHMKKNRSQPPPYSASTPPSAGIYPVLNISGGIMTIGEEPPVAPTPIDTKHFCPGSSSLSATSSASSRAPSSMSHCFGTGSEGLTDPFASAPFAVRMNRQEPTEQQLTDLEAALRSCLNEHRSVVQGNNRVASAPLSRSNPFASTPVAVKGDLTATAKTEPGTSPNVTVTMSLVGRQDPETQMSLAHVFADTANPPGGEETEDTDDELSNLNNTPLSTSPSLGYQTRSKGPVPQPPGMFPLVQTKAQRRPVYQPYSFGDVQALVDKLPDIMEGGNAWLAGLDKYTAGQDLALGDFRAIITRCTSRSQAADLEQNAGTTMQENEVPLMQALRFIGPALRKQFPPKNQGTLQKFKWEGKQNPTHYLNQAVEDWVNHTGHHPSRTCSQSMWFRRAVLRGIPESVSQKMEDNPDLQDCDFAIWKKHLIFNLNKVQIKSDDKAESVEDLQLQLLKVQLQKAKNDLGGKGDKPKKQLVAAAAPPPGPVAPDLYPNPWPADPQPPQYGAYHSPAPYGQRGSPFGGNGGGFRGRGQMGGGRGGQMYVCFRCGQPGHWAKACPLNPAAGRGRGARGGPYQHPGHRGGPRGALVEVPPAPQMPVMGWEYYEGGPQL